MKIIQILNNVTAKTAKIKKKVIQKVNKTLYILYRNVHLQNI